MYINEPAVTGGNPILASKGKDAKVLFNGMLGSTLGSLRGNEFSATDMTLFGEPKEGETEDKEAFFTGKPKVDGLGYAFLFRNYRSGLGKWQTADPLGYPDGWNNLAYCNNWVIECVDNLGADIYHLVDEDGASGNGHSGWIVGNDQDGYVYYDYGTWSDDEEPERETRQEFDTLDDAINAALDQDDYGHMQKWDTIRAQDAAAIEAADDYIDEDYDWATHNCYLLGPKSMLDAVNAEDMTNAIAMCGHAIPNLSFKVNNKQSYAEDITDELEEYIEQRAE